MNYDVFYRKLAAEVRRKDKLAGDAALADSIHTAMMTVMENADNIMAGFTAKGGGTEDQLRGMIFVFMRKSIGFSMRQRWKDRNRECGLGDASGAVEIKTRIPADQVETITLKQLAARRSRASDSDNRLARTITDRATALEWYLACGDASEAAKCRGAIALNVDGLRTR